MDPQPPVKPFSYYFGSDVLGLVFSWTPVLFAWSCGLAWFWHFWSAGPAWLCLLTPFASCFGLFAILFVMRQCLPRLRKGVYPTTPNKMLVSWWAQVLMGRAVDMSGLKPIVFATGFLRFLYFRAMGAKISYNTSFSLNVDLVDYPMITIQEGVLVGELTRISAHSLINDRFILKPIEVRRGAFISSSCILGQGTTVKEGAQVGFGNILYGMTIEAGQKIADFEYSQGPKRGRNPVS